MKSDTEILTLYAQESTKELAFIALINQTQKKLYAVIFRILQDHNDTDDVLQDTYIKVWRSLHTFKGDSALYSWLYRIATNTCFTFIQKKKLTHTLDLPNDDEILSHAQMSNAVMPDINQLLLISLLEKAISQLPAKQRIVFCMRYYDETPYSTMAQILLTSEGALKASYHHAVKKIETFILNHI